MRTHRPISPGEILKEELEARDWSIEVFASMIKRHIERVKSIIKGGKITKLEAQIIAKALGTSSHLWMRLQEEYDVDRS